MKKFTFTFIVNDETVEEIQNDLTLGLWQNAFNTLEENCEDSKYDIKEYEG